MHCCHIEKKERDRESSVSLAALVVAHHLQGGGGALELQMNNVASQGCGGISPGASRQSLRTLGSWPGALSSLSCQDHGYLCVTLKEVNKCFALFCFFPQFFFNKRTLLRSGLWTRCKQVKQTIAPAASSHQQVSAIMICIQPNAWLV